ncbi:hypothetical protein CTAYLR_008753 [Chrysophaeum taylorii]|uniref:Casein kinase I n=1 Tax=Chrysophaeum taylorii TaxID=2483200 RepID=A0AAD7UCP8_9STRA|nr:hypothetical protein CTAYLR_008753 [Chrysophaeum taylorii]
MTVGSGACAEVFVATRVGGKRRRDEDEWSYVVKVSPLPTATGRKGQEQQRVADLLYFEHVVYHTVQNPRYFATEVGYGEDQGYRFLALRRLGQSLSARSDRVGSVARDVLEALQALHGTGYVYGDMKPDNILLGVWEGDGPERLDEARLVDFGVASKFRSALTGGHKTAGCQAGTQRFASATSLRDGNPPSRRDDVEALGHVLLWRACGGWLPWDDARSAARLDEIKLRLVDVDATLDACADRLPPPLRSPLGDFLKTCRSMAFTDVPDYDALRACVDRIDDPLLTKKKRRHETQNSSSKTTTSRPPPSSTRTRRARTAAAAAAVKEPGTTNSSSATSYEACMAKAKLRRRPAA